MRSAADALVVVSWNVHSCVGHDGRCDPERVAAALCALDADVIALQEVDVGYRHGRDQLAALARATGTVPIPGPTIVRGDGSYGNGVLTRLPVLEAKGVDLTCGGPEPRGALEVRLDTPHGPLVVVDTHLGLLAAERARQVARLVPLVDRDPDVPLVLAGDLNEWRPWSRTLAAFDLRLGPAPRPRTFPACLPVLPLDRVWARPAGSLLEVRAVAEAAAASDHLPLVARVRWW